MWDLRWINRAAWVAAVLLVFFRLPSIGQQDGGSDFNRMWSCALALADGNVGNLYSQAGHQAMIDFVNDYSRQHWPDVHGRFYLPWVGATFTPALLTTFALFKTDDLFGDAWNFHLYSKLIFGFGFLVLAAALDVPGILVCGTLWLVSATSQSFIWVQRWGNIECMQVGILCITICLLKGRRPPWIFLAGLLLGLSAAIKPTALMSFVLLGIAYLAARQRRQATALAGGILAAAIVAVILPLLVLGRDATWMNWWKFTYSINANTRLQDKSAFLAEFLNELNLSAIPSRYANYISMGFLAVIFSVWALSASREIMLRNAFRVDAGAVAAGSMLFLFTGPYVFGRYMMLVVPAALVAMRQKPPQGWFGRLWVSLAIGSLYLAGNPKWTSGHDSWPAFEAYLGCLVIFGMLVVGRMFAIEFDRPDPDHLDQPAW